MITETIHSPVNNYCEKENNKIPVSPFKVRISLVSLIFTSSVSLVLSCFVGNFVKNSWLNRNISSSQVIDQLQSSFTIDSSELVHEKHNETFKNVKPINKKLQTYDNFMQYRSTIGQHLMIDINIPKRMNKRNFLEQTLLNLIKELDLNILSYHCLNLDSDGMTCVGILTEGHISLVFWPKNEVLSVDVLSFESNDLFEKIHDTRTIQMLSNRDEANAPVYKWAYRSRGQKSELGSDKKLKSLGHFSPKEDMMFLESKCIGNSNDRLCNAKMKQSSRFSGELYLDGNLQTQFLSDRNYHESLVHPGLFAHDNPKRVAIFGGSDGATLREVIKHKTVEKVVLVVPDVNLVALSKEYFPSRSDCSDLIGSSPSCFDDSRVEILEQDPTQYLLGENEYVFDVIIMDIFDPVEGQDKLIVDAFTEQQAIQGIYGALSKDGIVITQLGQSPESYDSPSKYFKTNDFISYFIEDIYMQSAFQYENFYQRYSSPWSYVVMCKTKVSNANWFYNSAEIDVSLHKRLIRTHSQTPSLYYFDATVMKSFQVPPKAFEVVYCRSEYAPIECKLLSSYPTFPNAEVSSFEVRQSTLGKGGGRGVFSKVDIPKDTIITLEMAQLNVKLYPKTTNIVEKYVEKLGEDFEGVGPYAVYSYMHAYGFSIYFFEGEAIFVDGSIMTFVNHGCNSTDNLGSLTEHFIPGVYDGLREENFTMGSEVALLDSSGEFDTNPAVMRHIALFNSALDFARVDIKAGDEIFQNYLTYESEPEELLAVVELFKRVCRGEAVGEVSKYENGEKIH